MVRRGFLYQTLNKVSIKSDILCSAIVNRYLNFIVPGVISAK